EASARLASRGEPCAPNLRRSRAPRAAPAPLRGEQRAAPDTRRARARRLRDVPGGTPRRDRRAPGSPVVRREPVPPRVQVASDPPGAPLSRLRGRGARARSLALGRAGGGLVDATSPGS